MGGKLGPEKESEVGVATALPDRGGVFTKPRNLPRAP